MASDRRLHREAAPQDRLRWQIHRCAVDFFFNVF